MDLFLYSDFLSFSSGCPILAREAMLKSWLEYWILGIEKEVKLSCHIFEFQILTSVRFTQSRSLVFVFSNKDQINTKTQTKEKQKAHKPRCYGIYEPCVWCGKRDLNPYVKDTRPSNVPVCLFQHCRII